MDSFIFSIISPLTKGIGAIVPIPPVFGPVSPSPILLWSCDVGNIE
jgi:hypothetical protein